MLRSQEAGCVELYAQAQLIKRHLAVLTITITISGLGLETVISCWHNAHNSIIIYGLFTS